MLSGAYQAFITFTLRSPRESFRNYWIVIPTTGLWLQRGTQKSKPPNLNTSIQYSVLWFIQTSNFNGFKQLLLISLFKAWTAYLQVLKGMLIEELLLRMSLFRRLWETLQKTLFRRHSCSMMLHHVTSWRINGLRCAFDGCKVSPKIQKSWKHSEKHSL